MSNLPPVAMDVICVDFDGTLFEWGTTYERTNPIPGAVEFMQKLRKDGWYIVIFTSRMSPTWWESEGRDFGEALEEETRYIENRLDEFNIPYDRITAEKVPAAFYIDDRAISFYNNNWYDIEDEVNWHKATMEEA